MKTYLLFLLMLVGFSSRAQLNTNRYLNDPISFAYQTTSWYPENGKEVRFVQNFKYIVRVIGDKFRVITIFSEDAGKEVKFYTEGELASMDVGPAIVLDTAPRRTSIPSAIYKATFFIGGDLHKFTEVTDQGQSEVESVTMYFPSERAALEVETILQNLILPNSAKIASLFEDAPKTACNAKSIRYKNEMYGYALCLEASETVSDLSYRAQNYTYLSDLITIKGSATLPYSVYTIDSKHERDSLKVFKQFEDEVFARLGPSVTPRNTLKDSYSPALLPGQNSTFLRVYIVSLASGGYANIGFNYLLNGNGAFNMLCFFYMTPMNEINTYLGRNLEMIGNCKVLKMK